MAEEQQAREVDSVCLVLGAGATLANSLYFHSQRFTSTTPPLDYSFFDRIEDLGILIPRQLRSYADSLPGPSPFDKPIIGQVPRRMEEFLKDLFNDFQQAGPNSTVAIAYAQLVDVYTRVLRETTNWLCEDQRLGAPIGRLIAMACDMAQTVNIVTFNHDLVIENEITKRARLRSKWCLEQGYGSFGRALQLTSGPDPFPRHGRACNHDLPINILKLHGSLNWYLRISGRRPTASLLSGTRTPPRIYATRRRFVFGKLRYTLPTKQGARGRRSWYTWPVVIPPIYGKEALIRAFVPDVWSDARTALETADRVVIFGYSMPLLDIQAERLIQRSLASNSAAPRIDVINPAAEAVGRYATLLPFKPMRWYPTAEMFLQQDSLA